MLQELSWLPRKACIKSPSTHASQSVRFPRNNISRIFFTFLSNHIKCHFTKAKIYINYFYHLRLLSSFSTKIQDATARVATPVINPINKPNANILFTLLYNINFSTLFNDFVFWSKVFEWYFIRNSDFVCSNYSRIRC